MCLANYSQARLTVANRQSSWLGFVYTVPNGSGPKIEPDRPSVYTGPFWNRSGTDPKVDLLFRRSNFGSIWIRSGPVPERSRASRSRSSLVRFVTVPVRSPVNIALAFFASFRQLSDGFLLHLANQNARAVRDGGVNRRKANMALVNSVSPSSHIFIDQFKRKPPESC